MLETAVFLQSYIPSNPTLGRFWISFVFVALPAIVVGFPNGLNSYIKLCVAVILFGTLLVFFATVSTDYGY